MKAMQRDQTDDASDATPAAIWKWTGGAWPDSVRIGAGVVGAALVTAALRRRGGLGALAGIVGAALVARSLAGVDAQGVMRAVRGRRAFKARKATTIEAPVDRVFAFFEDFAQFPRFMENVHEVKRVDENRWQWVVQGPAGVDVSWEALVTKNEPNRLIAWATDADEALSNGGRIEFASLDDGSTRVEVTLGYRPPLGAAGHAGAMFFGVDPESQLEQALSRVKELMATGVAVPEEPAAAHK